MERNYPTLNWCLNNDVNQFLYLENFEKHVVNKNDDIVTIENDYVILTNIEESMVPK